MNTQTQTTEKNQLLDKQSAEIKALQIKHNLQNQFVALTGLSPSIISPENKPFAVFYPENSKDYLTILEALHPTGENFTVTFASGKDIPTFSPYSIHYGGEHNTPNYMEVVVKYKHSICPVWVKMPDGIRKAKFSVSTLQGKHRGFGNYESIYTLSANEGGTTVQKYYGNNKTMYAANEAEAEQLKNFIFLI